MSAAEAPLRSARLATPADLGIIARIHKSAYSRNHFTALLSEEVLERYYASFLSDGAEILLEIETGEGRSDVVLGFAVYGLRIPEKIAVFKRSSAKAILLTSLQHPWISTKKALKAVAAQLAKRTPYPPADFLLLSIAVAHPLAGVGKTLLYRMLEAADRRGQAVAGLYVNSDNIRAINAYFSAGFRIKHLEDGQYYMEAPIRVACTDLRP